jgi:hypothetical protein
MAADTPVRSPQKLFRLSGIVELYSNSIAQLFVDHGEAMLGDSVWRGPAHDQLPGLPRAMSWLRRMPFRVEEPPQNGRLWRSSSPFGHIDHEYPVAGELCTVGTDLPVVLHDDLITDVELENDHRSCRSRRARRWTSDLLFDACPVAKQREEKLTQTHPSILSCSTYDPDARSSQIRFAAQMIGMVR